MVEFSNSLDWDGPSEKDGKKGRTQLTQLCPCVEMGLAGDSRRAWFWESEHERPSSLFLWGVRMDGHPDRLPQIFRMVAAISVVVIPSLLDLG